MCTGNLKVDIPNFIGIHTFQISWSVVKYLSSCTNSQKTTSEVRNWKRAFYLTKQNPVMVKSRGYFLILM